ncbi:MAG: DUF192 domain-containing protein [bacterium]|nr:DUF192 domain-containing protein [bacterium]
MTIVFRLMLLIAACTAAAGLGCSTTSTNGTGSQSQSETPSTDEPAAGDDGNSPTPGVDSPDGGNTEPSADPNPDDDPDPIDDPPINPADSPDPTDDDDSAMDLLDQTPEDDLLDETPNADYLGGLPLAYLRGGDEVFLTWVADTFDTRQRGLMFVTAEELAPPPEASRADRRAMLFIFTRDNTIGFWMRDTITALDVAYLRTDGTIDSIQTMEPLDESIYPPDGPYRYALEITAGSYTELGLRPGDRVELPDRYRDE